MPGEFRAFAYRRSAMRNADNQKLAKSYGLEAGTDLCIVFTGGEKIMRYLDRPASSLCAPPPPG